MNRIAGWRSSAMPPGADMVDLRPPASHSDPIITVRRTLRCVDAAKDLVRTPGRQYEYSMYLIGVADAGIRIMQMIGLTELERDARVYRRDRENCGEQTKWHERRFAAA
jgi:hypothetical protein